MSLLRQARLLLGFEEGGFEQAESGGLVMAVGNPLGLGPPLTLRRGQPDGAQSLESRKRKNATSTSFRRPSDRQRDQPKQAARLRECAHTGRERGACTGNCASRLRS